jgi:uncharacterized DUF497 family protein
MRDNELRTQSFSYVMNCLRVLTVVHIDRDDATRVISYRRARDALNNRSLNGVAAG